MIKKMLCKHEYISIKTIHGDEIRTCGWKRTVLRCRKCAKIKLIEDFHMVGTEVSLKEREDKEC